jgi:hypothetical protein
MKRRRLPAERLILLGVPAKQRRDLRRHLVGRRGYLLVASAEGPSAASGAKRPLVPRRGAEPIGRPSGIVNPGLPPGRFI